jgi:hypothetical protein
VGFPSRPKFRPGSGKVGSSADIPDVHAHAGAIEAGIPVQDEWSSLNLVI